MKLVTETNCPYPWDWAMITADGGVRPCCFGGIVGNLNSGSWEDIWNGRTMRELRYAVDHNLLHATCKNAACTYSQHKAHHPRIIPIDDHRYAFQGLAVSVAGNAVSVSGRILNTGELAWHTIADTGKARLTIGGRVGRNNDQVVNEVRHHFDNTFVFPGEFQEFSISVSMDSGEYFEVDLVFETHYWFSNRGASCFRYSF